MAEETAVVAPKTARVVNDWTEKHRPQALADLVGNSKAIQELVDWANSWKEGTPDKERAVVLAGEPGVGKTSAAHALARDMGWGVIELNASDQRNEEVIRRIAGSGARNMAFGADGGFSREAGGRQLVILDEADNLFGREDRGGMKAITDTIREARQPIVLIANDLYELQRKGGALKTLARTIKFTKVHSRSIPPAIKRIAAAENLTLEPGVAEAIAEKAGGDLRSAVNDLQSLSIGRDRLTLDDVKTLGARDSNGDVWGMLGKVFYGSSLDEARRSTWDLDETPDAIALWIDENLPVMYTDKADLVEGYKWLSRADVYLGRVSRRQQYGLWSYAGALMTGGVAVAKHERPRGARFQFPSWLRKQSSSRAMRELRNRTANKLGAALHTSGARVRMDVFPYVKMLMAQDDEFAAWAVTAFDLEADELAFLLDAKPTTAKVKKLIEAAQSERDAHARAHTAASIVSGRRADTVVLEDVADDEEGPLPVADAGDDTDRDEPQDAPPAAKPKPKRATAKGGAKPAAAGAKPAEADGDAKGGDAPEEPAAPSESKEDAKRRQRNLFDF